MSAWQLHKINDIGKVITGKTPPSSQPELLSGTIPFLTPGDMSEDKRDIVADRFVSSKWDPKRRLLLPKDAICVVCIGMTIGKVCMTNRPSYTNQQINSVVVDKDRFDPHFVFYSLRSKAPEIRVRATGAQTRIINKSVFSDVTISAPPLYEQRRIAAILGVYDDLIEINKRQAVLLEAMARALFEEWFVRFRFPGHEGVAITNTSDGPLPEGWERLPFSKLADFANGFAFKPSDFEEDGLPIVKIPELKHGVSGKTPRNSGERVPDHLIIQTGDLLFSWSGTFAVGEWTGGPALLNQHLFVVTPTSRVERPFLREALRHALPRFDLQGVGATMKHIRRSALDTVYTVVPQNGVVLAQANDSLRGFYSQIVSLRCQNAILVSSRDLLLPRLISGQLSVTAAERELLEAA